MAAKNAKAKLNKPRRKFQTKPPAAKRRTEISNSTQKAIDFPSQPNGGRSYATIEVKDNGTSQIFINLDGVLTEQIELRMDFIMEEIRKMISSYV